MLKKYILVIILLIFMNSCWLNINNKEIQINELEIKEEIKNNEEKENKLNDLLEKSKNFSEKYWWIQKENYENNRENWIKQDKNKEIKEDLSIKQEVKKEEKFKLKWFKDDLFSYKWVLEEKLDWNWRLIQFSMKEDVEDRDEIDVDKVFEHYIDRKTEEYREIKWLYWVEWFSYYEVTDRNQKDEDKKLVVLYFHWKWWNKTWWINDETFWWNFNRIQNLMIENSWVYITTDTELWVKSENNHWKLLKHLKTKYKNAKIILIWWSNWWIMLWKLLNNKEYNKFIDWIILSWTILDENKSWYSTDFLIKNRIPVYIAHWNKDHIQFWEKEIFLKSFLSQWWLWKVVIFNWWIHGTPIRMIDYKEAINWMIEYFSF